MAWNFYHLRLCFRSYTFSVCLLTFTSLKLLFFICASIPVFAASSHVSFSIFIFILVSLSILLLFSSRLCLFIYLFCSIYFFLNLSILYFPIIILLTFLSSRPSSFFCHETRGLHGAEKWYRVWRKTKNENQKKVKNEDNNVMSPSKPPSLNPGSSGGTASLLINLLIYP